MPRSFYILGNAAWVWLWISISASPTATLRAETPVNPLRPAALSIALAGAQTEGVAEQQGPAAWRLNPVEPTIEPPSVVPREFGQPELLPPAIGTSGIPADKFGSPQLWDDAPWPNLVHPLFDDPWFSHGDPNDPHRHIGIGQ